MGISFENYAIQNDIRALAEDYSCFVGFARIKGDPEIKAIFKSPEKNNTIALNAEQTKNVALTMADWWNNSPSIMERVLGHSFDGAQVEIAFPNEPGHSELVAKVYVKNSVHFGRIAQLEAQGALKLPVIPASAPVPEAATKLPPHLQGRTLTGLLTGHGWAKQLADTYERGSDYRLPITRDGKHTSFRWVPVHAHMGPLETPPDMVSTHYTFPRGIQQAAGQHAHAQRQSFGGPRQQGQTTSHSPQMR